MEKKVFVIFLFLVLAIFISFPHTCISQTNTFPSTGNVGIGTTGPGAILQLAPPSGQFGLPTSTAATSPRILKIWSPAYTSVGLDFGVQASGGTKGWIQARDQASDSTYYDLLLNPLGGNVSIGTTSPGSRLDLKGTLRLSGSSSGYVGFAPQAGAGSTTYTLPASDGTNGQVLTTNGAGQLSWADKDSSTNLAIRVVSFTLPGTAIAGENKTCSFIVPFNFTITKAYAYARTVPTGAALIFDIIKNGTSIWHTNPGNRLQITSSQNMGIQTNFDTTTFAELDIIDIDLVQIGSSIAGADITVEIKGTVS